MLWIQDQIPVDLRVEVPSLCGFSVKDLHRNLIFVNSDFELF